MKIRKLITNLAVLGRSFVGAYLELRKSEPDLLESVAENMQAALVAFEAKDAEFRASSSLLSGSLQPALDQANASAEAVLVAAKKVLELKAGPSWSPVWGEAGFALNSTRIPVKWEARVLLLEKLATFFQKRADWENADYQVTSVNLLRVSVALTAAAQAKKQHEASHRQLSKQRDALAARLRTRLNSLVAEVKHVLAPDDVRWKAFNLPTPEEAKSEAYQEARERKESGRAATRQERRLDAAFRQLTQSRIRAEKTRARYERALATLNGLKEEVAQSAAEIAEAEAKVESLGGNGTNLVLLKTAETADRARQVHPNGSAPETAVSALVS